MTGNDETVLIIHDGSLMTASCWKEVVLQFPITIPRFFNNYVHFVKGARLFDTCPCFALQPTTDKTVLVRYLNMRECFCFHPRLLGDDVVEEKEVSAHRVSYVVRERLGSIERHGTKNIVEQRGRVMG
jgi:hypothetical protein